MCPGIRVQPIVEEMRAAVIETFEQERHQRGLMFPRELLEYTREAAGICRSVIRWQLHAGEQHDGITRLNSPDDVGKISLDAIERQSAQAVIGAEFDDDDVGAVSFECGIEAGQAATGGFPADTDVDHSMRIAVAYEPLLH